MHHLTGQLRNASCHFAMCTGEWAADGALCFVQATLVPVSTVVEMEKGQCCTDCS